MTHVTVIGGGAAGIIAAWRAASCGARVTLLEKNDRLGIKILISGGGKCNITHDGPMESLLKSFRTNEARFLRPSFYRFSNSDVLDLLVERGIEVTTRPDGRLFPLNGNAKDVMRAFDQLLHDVSVIPRISTPVSAIQSVNGKFQIHTQYSIIDSDRVIIAVGGNTYPGTGATGDGWKWAQDFGHNVTKIRAALAPMFLYHPRNEWSGLAIRDCILKAMQGGKEITRWRGDLLWTHRGVSGPCALGVSREVAERRSQGLIQLTADVIPDLSFEAIQQNIATVCRSEPKSRLLAFIRGIVPDRMAPVTLSLAGIPEDRIANQLTARERNRLIEILKAWPIGDVEHVPLEKGEVAAGGVDLSEVEPHTMQSRLVSGLYFAGEILDVAGPVGGYNLQAAFSTGYVSGDHAARS